MSFQSSGIKENIQLSQTTLDTVKDLADLLHVDLTPDQLLVCVEIIRRGGSPVGLHQAIKRFSNQVSCKNHRIGRSTTSKLAMSNDRSAPFRHRRISPIPFLMDSSPNESGPTSPLEHEPTFDPRHSLRAEWDAESEVMNDIIVPPEMDRFINISIEHSNSRPWTTGESSVDSDEWLQREARNPATSIGDLQTTTTEQVSSTSRSVGTGGGESSTVSDTGATGGSPSSEALLPGNVDDGATTMPPMLSVNDENGDDETRIEEGADIVIGGGDAQPDNNPSHSTSLSSIQTNDFDEEDADVDTVVGEEVMHTPTNLMAISNDHHENDRPPDSPPYLSPTFFSLVYDNDVDNNHIRPSPTPLRRVRLGLENITERENSSIDTTSVTPRSRERLRATHRNPSSFSGNDQPPPLKLPSNTRLKLTIKKWNVAASWKWTAGDETCGICRMPFEACCIECKTPGDECPLAIGNCKHAFHMHCIVKWTETQNTPRPQCPLCRQEWKFAAG
ncbi:unnamed protein product [Anisakis simplex]|uniref:Anaphase-promoting complex subunit 11 n=1 Tax=Anisakis simplex TaxID=6269 RepID=A0A0M3K594_ANISI|nr:unnamed protein product [Anisakis simplex]